MGESLLLIEVAYARVDEQVILELQIPNGSDVEQAIITSGILKQYPEINLDQNEVGIFGKVCNKKQHIESGDRVEIYRQLICDPKEARKIRAAKE
jgi:putative ubiquitin-RnfH superfamily antitoxin RatB of RatAB toxin-antitoxin module